MDRTQLYKKVSEKASDNNVKYAQKDVENILNAYADVVLTHLSKTDNADEKVPAPGLGNWGVKVVKAREGVSKLMGGKAWKSDEHNALCMHIFPKAKKFQA